MKKIAVILLALLLTSGMALAQNNDSEIKQYGTNIGEVFQKGDGNEGNIYQGSSANPVSNAATSSWKLGSWIDQIGNDNYANTDVNNSSNGTSIDQLGNDNWAWQQINTFETKTTNWNRMGADIDQNGNDNYGWQKTVYSFGCYGIQGMLIDQDGNDNYAKQFSKGGMAGTMEVIQNGNNNNNSTTNPLDVSCTGQRNPLTLPWAEKPGGAYTQYQNGRYSVAHAKVTGSDNNTAQYQEYTVWSISGDNDAYIDITGNGNDAVQGQLGEYNYSDIDIQGNDNVMANSQWGDSNTATFSIIGDRNCAGIEQRDNNNTGLVLQNGNDNIGLIKQIN